MKYHFPKQYTLRFLFAMCAIAALLSWLILVPREIKVDIRVCKGPERKILDGDEVFLVKWTIVNKSSMPVWYEGAGIGSPDYGQMETISGNWTWNWHSAHVQPDWWFQLEPGGSINLEAAYSIDATAGKIGIEFWRNRGRGASPFWSDAIRFPLDDRLPIQ